MQERFLKFLGRFSRPASNANFVLGDFGPQILAAHFPDQMFLGNLTKSLLTLELVEAVYQAGGSEIEGSGFFGIVFEDCGQQEQDTI